MKTYYNLKIAKALEERLGRGRVKTGELLSLHTTFKIGGPADYYFEAGTTEELIEAVKFADQLKLSYFILGGGSNILVGDKGFRGLVIKNKSKNLKILGMKGKIKNHKTEINDVLMEVDSGLPLNQLVRFTIEEGLGGLEEFLGLPGTVGGAVVGRSHWHDKKVVDLVISRKNLGKNILLSLTLRLKKENKEILWQRAREVMEHRCEHHPMDFPSAGCIFKNIKPSEALKIGTPRFTCSAGSLIENVGLKGQKIGGMQISNKHANFMVNLGTGKAADVVKLIDLVKETVKEKFGIRLEEEIIKVGEF